MQQALIKFIADRRHSDITAEYIRGRIAGGQDGAAAIFAKLWDPAVSSLEASNIRLVRRPDADLYFDVHFQWSIFNCVIKCYQRSANKPVEGIKAIWANMLLNKWKELSPQLVPLQPCFVRINGDPSVDVDITKVNIDDIEVYAVDVGAKDIIFDIIIKDHMWYRGKLPNGASEITKLLEVIQVFKRPKKLADKLVDHYDNSKILSYALPDGSLVNYVTISQLWYFPTRSSDAKSATEFLGHMMTFDGRDVSELLRIKNLNLKFTASEKARMADVDEHIKLIAESPMFDRLDEVTTISESIILPKAYLMAYAKLTQAAEDRIAANRAAGRISPV